MAKELLRMQLLAGIITESQYNERMDEAEGEKVDLDQLASELAGELKLNPGEVDKSMDLVDEGKLDEDYLTGTAVGWEVVPGLVALVGGLVGGVVGYLKWSKNANLRDYVEQEATFIVQDKIKKLGLTPNEIGKAEMKKLVKLAVQELQKDPEFMKKAQTQSPV
jgi:hypothetical protein